MIKLKYGNTNSFFIQGGSGLVVDTDYAGTLPAFYKALKQNNIKVRDIGYVLATHYHPDHMGLVGELMGQGVTLLLIDVQKDFVHFSDAIFERLIDEQRRFPAGQHDQRRNGILIDLIHNLLR